MISNTPMGTHGVGRWAALACGLLFAACAHTLPASPQEPEQTFRIGREDVLDVAVWRDAELSRTLPVRPDGYISLPMVGEVLAAGRTPTELAEEIRHALQPYVQEPRVTVIIREVNSSRVFVTGEVARPGAFPLRGRLSVLQALALAGGLTDFADRNAITVLRASGERMTVSYSDLVSEERARPLPLQPGDTIVVP
jgi:polysaccharide biosynthesis/export protein